MYVSMSCIHVVWRYGWGASPGQGLATCHVIRYPCVQTHQCVVRLKWCLIGSACACAMVGHMPRHAIPTCPNASMCSAPQVVFDRQGMRMRNGWPYATSCDTHVSKRMVFERKGFAREMVSIGATTYTVCWVGTDRGAAPARLSSGV